MVDRDDVRRGRWVDRGDERKGRCEEGEMWGDVRKGRCVVM